MSSPTRRPLGDAASLNGLEGVFLPSRIDVLLNLSYLLTILSRNKVLFKGHVNPKIQVYLLICKNVF